MGPTDSAIVVDPIDAYFESLDGGYRLLEYGSGFECTAVLPAEVCAELP